MPSTWFDNAKGEPLFSGATKGILGGDLAFLNDKAVIAVGRYGMATGWIDWEGNENRFVSRKTPGQFEQRHCSVLDRLIVIKATDNHGVAEEIKQWAESMDIEPNCCVMDMTGNGFGVVSHLQKFWGPVEGIHWKQSATKLKILTEDRTGSDEQTANKVSEMYWALRRWTDPRVRGFFINPNCEGWEKVRHQLITRGYKHSGIKVDVESKESYMKRFPVSPDEADALVMMTMAPRLRNLGLPALVDEEAKQTRAAATKTATKFRTSDRPESSGPAWAGVALNGGREARLPTELTR